MKPPLNVEELQSFLDHGAEVDSHFPALFGTGVEVDTRFPALFGTGSWTLLQVAAFAGTPDMTFLLLLRGASVKYLTDESRSAVDLACDAENWESFELLRSAADNQYCYIKTPSLPIGTCPRKFYPSRFFVTLRNPFDYHVQKLSSKDYEDMIQRTNKLRADGQLHRLVPYPEKNKHLIGEPIAVSATVSVFQFLTTLQRAIPGSSYCCDHAPTEGQYYRTRVSLRRILVTSVP